MTRLRTLKHGLAWIGAGAAMILVSGCSDETLTDDGLRDEWVCRDLAPPDAGAPTMLIGEGADADFVPLQDGATLQRGTQWGGDRIVVTGRWNAPATNGMFDIELVGDDSGGPIRCATGMPNDLGCDAWMEVPFELRCDRELQAGTAGTLRATGSDVDGVVVATAEVDVVLVE